MIRSSTLKTILLYLNNFPQNTHITTLFIAHVSILLMPVNQFSWSCEETLREARKRTKKKETSQVKFRFENGKSKDPSTANNFTSPNTAA